MDQLFQAFVMGLVQGLTEFLPISSSAHLIVVPAIFGWDDPFITSLPFSVVLHLGTLGALLVYFRAEWRRLVPAGFAAIRDRSFAGDPDRRLAWLIAIATIPALAIGFALNDVIEVAFRRVELVAVTLVVGAGILWLADRVGGTDRRIPDLGFGSALAVGFAQALALIPGISRSGVSIAAGRFIGLDRASAARFSFLLATPVTAAAGSYEVVTLVRADLPFVISPAALAVGVVTSFVSGLFAIGFLLRFLEHRSLTVFVVYRLVLAAVIVVAWLGLTV
jgi:undecaprenyl-diphosphatase